METSEPKSEIKLYLISGSNHHLRGLDPSRPIEVIECGFETEAERAAFLWGVEAALGWEGYLCSEVSAEKVMKLLAEVITEKTFLTFEVKTGNDDYEGFFCFND